MIPEDFWAGDVVKDLFIWGWNLNPSSSPSPSPMPDPVPEHLATIHPHDGCPKCKDDQNAHIGAFVIACQQLYRGSWSELFEKLSKRGFKIIKTTDGPNAK